MNFWVSDFKRLEQLYSLVFLLSPNFGGNGEKAVLPIAVAAAFKNINKKHLFPKHIHANMLRHTHFTCQLKSLKNIRQIKNGKKLRFRAYFILGPYTLIYKAKKSMKKRFPALSA